MLEELNIKCLDCEGEEFTLSHSRSEGQIKFTCDGCGASVSFKTGEGPLTKEEGAKQHIRQEGIHAGIHETLPRGKVYFISSDAKEAPVKIGYTTSQIEDRVRVLQTGHPHKLEVLACVDGGYPLETAFHKIFASHRLYGEWFKRTPELTALVNALSQR
jgi:ribosomal protein S27E